MGLLAVEATRSASIGFIFVKVIIYATVLNVVVLIFCSKAEHVAKRPRQCFQRIVS